MERILKITKSHNRIRMGYGVAVILLLLAYFSTFYANRQLLKQSGKVEHTNKVIANLEIILSSLKDGETGIRGYIITKNPDFLDPYYGVTEKVYSFFDEVVNLTADNQLQQQRLKGLKKHIVRRFELFYSSLQAYNKSNGSIDDTLIRVQEDAKVVMDDIRLEISGLQNEERNLLSERSKKLKETFVAITTITVVSVLLAFLLIGFGFITYLKENKERKKAIHEIDAYQQQLKKQIGELNEANAELIRMRSQEKFAATGRIARTIAHEVRNPLTNINLAVDQLKTDIQTTDENAPLLFDMINRNSFRINQLISDLLNSTKFSELNYEKASANQLLDEVLEEAKDRIALTNIELVKNYTTESCDLSVDQIKIKIALLNIVINAIEAMENKEGSVLTLETKRVNTKCHIIISDNGAGMDSDAAGRLFEPYFSSKPNGNGLGLANTQNIILNHQGEISVKTRPGMGSSFKIVLNLIS